MGWNGSKWIRPEKRIALYSRDEHQCVWCGSRYGEDGVELTLDHVIPRSLGGDNTAGNLLTSCKKCNSARGNKSVRGFLSFLRKKEGWNERGTQRRLRRARRRNWKEYRDE